MMAAPMAKRSLPPALKQRAQAVKDAHAHLCSQPGFCEQHPHDRIRAVHAHIARTPPKKGGR